jgi:hypothetical protein
VILITVIYDLTHRLSCDVCSSILRADCQGSQSSVECVGMDDLEIRFLRRSVISSGRNRNGILLLAFLLVDFANGAHAFPASPQTRLPTA